MIFLTTLPAARAATTDRGSPPHDSTSMDPMENRRRLGWRQHPLSTSSAHRWRRPTSPRRPR
eukprot:712003-Prymnesium_polylepis.1